MSTTLYFQPEDLPQIQMELLMQILGYQKALVIVAANKDVDYSKEMIDSLAQEQRDKVLENLYVLYGKTPNI